MRFWTHICHLEAPFGIVFATLGSFLEDFGCIFGVDKQAGAPKVPQQAPQRDRPESPHRFGRLLEFIFRICFIFLLEKFIFAMCVFGALFSLCFLCFSEQLKPGKYSKNLELLFKLRVCRQAEKPCPRSGLEWILESVSMSFS